jgi:hypothetical protein
MPPKKSALQLAREKLGLKPDTGEKELVVNRLFERPEKEKGPQMPSFKRNYTEPGQVYQSDLLFMPDDNGYKYALVVVDVITGVMDALPLKDKTSAQVARGFDVMFNTDNNRPLKMPKFSIQVDPGSEFMGAVRSYFTKHKVMIRAGKPRRHRQQAQVEKRNWFIGKTLFEKQISKELLEEGLENREWVEHLPLVIEANNESAKAEYEIRSKKMNKKLEKEQPMPRLEQDKPILEIGTKVRVKLDEPESVHGVPLQGHFRAGDIKWKNKISTITNILLTPNQPVMYQVDGETTGYTRQQLQIVGNNEEKIIPRPRGTTTQKEVDKQQVSEEKGEKQPKKLTQANNELAKVAREVLTLIPPSSQTTRSGRTIKAPRRE